MYSKTLSVLLKSGIDVKILPFIFSVPKLIFELTFIAFPKRFFSEIPAETEAPELPTPRPAEIAPVGCSLTSISISTLSLFKFLIFVLTSLKIPLLFKLSSDLSNLYLEKASPSEKVSSRRITSSSVIEFPFTSILFTKFLAVFSIIIFVVIRLFSVFFGRILNLTNSIFLKFKYV